MITDLLCWVHMKRANGVKRLDASNFHRENVVKADRHFAASIEGGHPREEGVVHRHRMVLAHVRCEFTPTCRPHRSNSSYV
ncbi:hypothetical protein PI125_g15508 [Phytophthora idaei]|nr:hypothetical protein PI125_g15508 [Phytophthora idaei]